MLSEALRKIRQSSGESVSELARRLDVSKSHLSEVENNKKKPSLDLLQRFSDHYDLPLSHILFLSENFDVNEGKASRLTREYLSRFIVSQIG